MLSDALTATAEQREAAPAGSNVASPAADDAELADFFAALESLPDPGSAKKRITHLPGFLFPDGRAQLVVDEPEGSAEDEKTSSEPAAPVIIKFGSSQEECERLTSKVFANSFEVLNIPATASDEDVKKAFRKLSLLIHPDKCQDPRAQQAFHVVNKAYEDVQRPDMKDKYKQVYEEAQRRVLKDIAKANKLHAKNGKPLLSTAPEDIQNDVTRMCETLLEELNEKQEYAEKCRKANEAYEKEAEEKVLKEERKKMEEHKRWEEKRDDRVEDWREFKVQRTQTRLRLSGRVYFGFFYTRYALLSFFLDIAQTGVATKRVKIAAFVPVTHRREQRKADDKSVPKKPRGIDESYKENWR